MNDVENDFLIIPEKLLKLVIACVKYDNSECCTYYHRIEHRTYVPICII